jgi:hypothetical protein
MPPAMDGECIYCGAKIDVDRGEGDHVIPAIFGRFKGEFVFRRICRTHNSLLGKCEEQIARCAPESLMRRIVDAPRKRSRRGQKWVGAGGMPPPVFMVPRGDHSEFVEPNEVDPTVLQPFDQIVVKDADGVEHPVRLDPKMTAASLRTKISQFKKPLKAEYLHADQRNMGVYDSLLKEAFPGCEVVDRAVEPAGFRSVKGRTKFTYNGDYWRAIAKIAFHYYLLNTRRGFRGDEPAFDDLRRFLLSGGDPRPFFTNSHAKFLMPFRELKGGGAFLPRNWAHILASDESHTGPVVMVTLFIGPRNMPRSHHVTLAKFATPVILPRAQSCHAYLYEPKAIDGFAGAVEQISLEDLRPTIRIA